DATLRLVTLAHELGIQKIIVFSSAAASKEHLTPYSESKLEMENELQKLPFTVVIIRPTLVYSKGSKYILGMQKFCELPLPIIPLPGGETADLKPIHASDIGKGLLALLSEKNPYPKKTITFDFASTQSFTLADAIRIIAQQKNISKPIVSFPARILFVLDVAYALRLPFSARLSRLAAAADSYRVNPLPFMQTYGVVFSNPHERFPTCV
ncbi:MAG: hypothetical protein AABY11_04135, partial [archaeon]